MVGREHRGRGAAEKQWCGPRRPCHSDRVVRNICDTTSVVIRAYVYERTDAVEPYLWSLREHGERRTIARPRDRQELGVAGVAEPISHEIERRAHQPPPEPFRSTTSMSLLTWLNLTACASANGSAGFGDASSAKNATHPATGPPLVHPPATSPSSRAPLQPRHL